MSFPPPSERQGRIIWLALTGIALATLVALVVMLFWGLGWVLRQLSPVVWPLAIAGVLAYLLDPVVDFLERRGAKRNRAIAWVFALAVLIILALFSSVVPRAISEGTQLVRGIPVYAKRLEERVQLWITHPPALVRKFLGQHAATTNAEPVSLAGTNLHTEGLTNAWAVQVASSTNAPSFADLFGKERLESATGWVTRMLPMVGSWLFGQVGKVASWLGVIAGLALIPIYAFYFLLEKRAIASRWTDYLPVSDSGFKQELVFVLSSINGYLISFFRGQVLVAVCDGILYGIGFLLIGLPYAVLIGAAAVFLTIIPYVGAIVICISATVIAVVQFGDWSHPLLVLAVFGVVQALEGLVISPRIMGGRVGLHPVAIIIAVMAGTTLLGGLLGGILAIPLTAALRVIMFRYIWKRRGEGETTSENA
jgi:predicted PurR-regulated permease PerM